MRRAAPALALESGDCVAFTNDQLARLEEALAQGARKVKYADKEVEYRSLEEMQTLRRMMRKELGLDAEIQRVPLKFSKGFE